MATVTRPLGATVGDRTILVVEDTPAVLAIATRILTRAGYAVLGAEDGVAARAHAAAVGVRIHLILMDLTLPDERGPRVAADLRRLHPDARLVFTSGNLGVDEEAFLPPGRHWFLQKPFSGEQLLATVRQALDAPGEAAVATGGPAP